MKQALDLAVENTCQNGGPFAALVVKDGIVIATGVNQVTRLNDPTAHAEIMAIREACRVLGDFRLEGCDLYASCEPCPMCLGALFWARPDRIFYAATARDAAAAGFDDQFISEQMRLPAGERAIPIVHLVHEDAGRPFVAWAGKPDKKKY